MKVKDGFSLFCILLKFVVSLTHFVTFHEFLFQNNLVMSQMENELWAKLGTMTKFIMDECDLGLIWNHLKRMKVEALVILMPKDSYLSSSLAIVQT
jgi:hypothetical protein